MKHLKKTFAILIGTIVLQSVYAQEVKPIVTGIEVAINNSIIGIESADLNGDKYIDMIIVANNPYNDNLATVYIYQGNINGSFDKPEFITNIPVMIKRSISINLNDYNNDNQPDLMLTGLPHNNNEARIYYFENDGKGNFTNKTRIIQKLD